MSQCGNDDDNFWRSASQPPKTQINANSLSISIMVANKVPLKEKTLQVSGFIDLATRIHTESFLPYLTGQVPFQRNPLLQFSLS